MSQFAGTVFCINDASVCIHTRPESPLLYQNILCNWTTRLAEVGLFSLDNRHSSLHNIMQIALPALINPSIDSTLHRLELICRPVWFSSLIASLIMNPTICPRGKKKKKKMLRRSSGD